MWKPFLREIFPAIIALSVITFYFAARAYELRIQVLTGTLMTDRIGIGGEGTGFALKTPTGTVEIDLSADPSWKPTARQLAGATVTIRGYWVIHHGVETGQRRILYVVAFEKQSLLALPC